MSSKYDYRKIPKQRRQTKKEREKNERIFNIIIFVFSLIVVSYVFYATIYVAGDHEHIITVTKKEERHETYHNRHNSGFDGSSYYVYGINEKGKEKKYEIDSGWVSGRDLCTHSDIYDKMQEGCTYRVRTTGLCWGLEAEPLLNPVAIENKGAPIAKIKNPVPIAGILVLIYVIVSSVAFIVFSIKNPEFFQETFKDENVNYPLRHTKHMRIVYEYGQPILKHRKITIKGIVLTFMMFLLIFGPKMLISVFANWYFANF